MNKTFFLGLLCVLLTSMLSMAQQVAPCATDQLHQDLLKKSPVYKENFLKNQQQISSYIQETKKNRIDGTAETVYVIPLVVHVLEPSTGSSIMTDAEINTMISRLNNQLNAGTGYETSQDINIEFALAKRNPNCTATTGIVRVNMSGNTEYVTSGVKYSTENGIPQLTAKATSNWGNKNYYNLWIVNEIDGLTNNGVVGFAYFPGSSPDLDGALMIAPRLKDAGSTLLVHELAHAFGIYHTFEGSTGTSPNYNCPANSNPSAQGDFCADTDPMHEGGAFVGNCTVGFNTINPCTGNPYGNLYRNIMNYTPNSCSLMFTADQKARFRSGLLNSRPSLVNSNSLLPPPSIPVASACAPVFQYTALNYFFGIGDFRFNSNLISTSSVSAIDGNLYSDNSCFRTLNVSPGSVNNFSIQVFNELYVKAFIDFNNDGDFIDSGEQIGSGLSSRPNSSSPYVFSFNHTIPSTGVLQNQDLRLRLVADWDEFLSSCNLPGDGQYSGQVEDYSIRIVTACTPPAAPTVSSTTIETGQTATLNASGCQGGTIRWFDVATGGTSIATGSSLSTGVLTANKTYYASCTISCESTTRGSGNVTVLQCVANRTLGPSAADNISSGTREFLSSNGITAQNKITGGRVSYSAGKNVVLMPGFTVENGAVFVSMIGGCAN